MKQLTILLALLTLHSSLLTLQAALPVKWDVELTAQPPQVFTLQRPHGETYELEAVLKNRGKPFEPAITNACIYWQTNGMENLYWSAPASVSNNVLRAFWLPEMDPGAATVRGYIGDPGHIYAAAFQFRFVASPGATPNELPLPQKVIDFAKVTVLNPPWSGGGSGGVDTNAVRDIIRETVDGSARQLPPFLHYLEFDDTYPDAAAEWYAQADYSHGSCSAVRDGNTLSRNYDWNFNFMPEFVIRTVAASATGAGQPARFASLAVCNVGTNLTESDVTSGKWSKWYKALPGHAVDGINENGVVCEVNVVSGIPHDYLDNPTGDIHPLAAVRWALDNGTSAEMVATNLAARIMWPAGWRQNFHWMIADEAETWIVENGDAHKVETTPAVMTNFKLYPFTSGEGYERYTALTNGAAITNVWYTNAYSPSTDWFSDFGNSAALMSQAKALWNEQGRTKESHRGEKYGEYSWWQTVHTSVYDITNKTLRVAVQEQDDWYVFAVNQANVDLSPIEAQLAALQDGKRDLTDRSFEITEEYENWTPGNTPIPENPQVGSFYYGQVAFGSLIWTCVRLDWAGPGIGWIPGSPIQMSGDYTNPNATELTFPDGTKTYKKRTFEDMLALESQLAGKVDKVSGKGLSSNDYTDADKAEVAKVKDKADEFTEWVPDDSAPSGLKPQPEYSGDAGQERWYWDKVEGFERFDGGTDFYATSASWISAMTGRETFTATRKRVLRTGDVEPPGDYAAVSNAAIYASNTVSNIHIDATDPTFSNAVVSIAGELTPHPSPTLRLYDEVRQCYWIGKMVNGVMQWEVE